jgi:nicotinic acid phosphoribosyltransferase
MFREDAMNAAMFTDLYELAMAQAYPAGLTVSTRP